MRRAVLLAGAIALLAWIATGVAVIQQDEVGVLRRFGAARPEPWAPGLHWGWPWPVDRVDRVKVAQTRSLTVGTAGETDAPLTRAPDPEADDRLTGDLNLVTAQATVQYRVADPVRYLFAAVAAEPTLATITAVALTEALAAHRVDDVLTTGRAEVADRMVRAIQGQADRLGLGITVRAVRLGRVAPPAAVAEAFADAARARSDRRKLVTEAQEYRDRAEAEARGRVVEIADQAAARHDRAVQLARGEADRFRSVLAEARHAPEATTRRLYLESLSELLPRFGRKVVVPKGESVDLGLFADEIAGPAGPAPPAP